MHLHACLAQERISAVIRLLLPLPSLALMARGNDGQHRPWGSKHAKQRVKSTFRKENQIRNLISKQIRFLNFLCESSRA